MHDKYKQGKETEAPESADFIKEKGRKPNFLERKRFVSYEQPEEVQKAADEKEAADLKSGVSKQIKDGKIVETSGFGDGFEEEDVVVGGKGKPKRAEAVKSAPPKKTADAKKQDAKPEDTKVDASKNKETKKVNADEEFDLDGYSDNWGESSNEGDKPAASGSAAVSKVNV